MIKLDPRTKLALGLMAMVAVFIAHKPETLLAQCGIILFFLPFFGIGNTLIRSLRITCPMIALIFTITFFFYDVRTALLLSLRLLNLLTVSFILFRVTSVEEMGYALKGIGIPHSFVFIFTTAMRYVPLIGQKIRHIMDAQVSRGIDLRPKLKNARNFMALLMPLLIQSFILSDELAIAMETRGFGCKGRFTRKTHRLKGWDYTLMAIGLGLLIVFGWFENA
jgi:energy-coupling factor transport system permease protein